MVTTVLQAKVVFNMGNTEPEYLDPGLITGDAGSKIVFSLFEGLTSTDPISLKIIPGVAESWELSKDGLVYTFNLRKNLKWSDGKALTAQDFVWSWRRNLDPKTAAKYAYQLFYLKNGREFNSGKAKAEDVGAEAVNDYTLKVTLANPTPYFLFLVSFYTYFPLPKHVISKYNNEWTQPEHMVSNGPFVLKEWEILKHIKLEKNPLYWDKDQVKLDEIMVYPIENRETDEKMFISGEIDYTNDFPLIKMPLYQKNAEKNPEKYNPLNIAPQLSTYYYRLNVTKKPLDDVRVRKALALVVPRKAIVERVNRAGEAPATSFVPSGMPGYSFQGDLPQEPKPENIAKARELLKEAGYPDGKGIPKMDLLYNNSENHKKIAVFIQSIWKKLLNIDIELRNEEWKVYLKSQRDMNYSISRSAWVGDYPDANSFLDMYVAGGGQNQTGWSNKKYDELIAAAAKIINPKERVEKLQEAESILMEELPIIPIYYSTNKKLVAEKVRIMDSDGKLHYWKTNILDRLLTKYIRIVNQ